jgi:hypothetical protein
LAAKLLLIIGKDALVPCKGLHSIKAMRSSHRNDALLSPADFRWGPLPRHHHPAQTAHRSANCSSAGTQAPPAETRTPGGRCGVQIMAKMIQARRMLSLSRRAAGVSQRQQHSAGCLGGWAVGWL